MGSSLVGHALAQGRLGDASGRLAARGVKAAGIAAEKPRPEDVADLQLIQSAYPLLERLEVEMPWDKPLGTGTQALIDRRVAADPDLWNGLGFQIGTYLGIENPWAALVVDILSDPLSYATLGTGALLNLAGKTARITSAVTRGGRVAMTAEKSLNRLERTLEWTGKAIGDEGYRKKLLDAARKGISGKEYRALIAEADSLTQMPETVRSTLSALRKDRKALLAFMEATAKLPGRTLGPADVLQPTLWGRMQAGQVNPLIRFEKPFAFTRQLLGIPYRDATFWTPAAPTLLMGQAADKFLRPGTARAIAPELDIARLYRSPPKVTTPVTPDDVDLQLDLFQAGLGVPGSGLPRAVEIPEDDIFRVWVENHPSVAARQPSNPDAAYQAGLRKKYWDKQRTGHAFRAFKKDYIDAAVETSAERAAVSLAERDRRFSSVAAAIKASTGKPGLPTGIADELMATTDTQLAAIRASLSPKFFAGTGRDWGVNFLGASRVWKLQASNFASTSRELLHQAYAKREAREGMAEAMWHFNSHPDLFGRDSAGRLFLRATPEEIAEKSPLLAHTLARHRGLEASLRQIGADPVLGRWADKVRQTNDVLGRAQIDEHVIGEFVPDYMSRVLRPTAKGRRQLKKKLVGQERRALVREWFAEEMRGDNPVFKALSDLASKAEKVKRPLRASHEELRRATEQTIVRLIDDGLMTWDGDAIAVQAEYLASVSRSLLLNRLYDEMPELVGNVTEAHRDLLGAHIHTKAWRFDPDEEAIGKLIGQPIIRRDEPSDSLKSFYDHFAPLTRYGRLSSADRAELDFLRTLVPGIEKRKGMTIIPKTRQIVEAARNDVAARLHNATEIDGIRLLDNRDSSLARMQDGWIKSGSLPEWLAARDKVAAAIKRRINETTVGLQKRVLDRLDEIQAGAATEARTGGLWVLKPYASPIREGLAIKGRHEVADTALFRAFANVAYQAKSAVLWIDVFHGNVLSSISLMANPVRMARLLAEPREVFKTGMAGSRIAASGLIGRTAAGAISGGGITALLGGDEEEIGVGSLAGALWFNAITAAMRSSILAKRYSMTPTGTIHLAYMGFAGWNGQPADRAIGAVGRLLKGVKSRILAREGLEGPNARLLSHPIDGIVSFDEGFSQTLWETLHNGSKQFFFTTRFNDAYAELQRAGKLGKRVVEGVDLELLEASREIMQSAHILFGGQNMSALMRSPEFAEFYRTFLLSHDWTSSRLLGAANVLLNMGWQQAALAGGVTGAAFEFAEHGFDLEEMTANGFVAGAVMGGWLNRWASSVNARLLTKGDRMAREARRMWTSAILGMFVMGNLVNRAFTGRWMWENPEGQKLKVVLPNGGALGFKTWLEPFEYLGVEEKRPIPALSRIAQKVNPAIRTSVSLFTNRGFFGQPLIVADASPWEKAGSFVSVIGRDLTPIIAQGPARVPAYLMSGRQEPASVAGMALLRLGGLNVSNPPRAADFSQALSGLALSRERTLGALARQSPLGGQIR